MRIGDAERDASQLQCVGDPFLELDRRLGTL